MSVLLADSGTRFVLGSGVTTVDLDTFTINTGAKALVGWLHTASISSPVVTLDPLGTPQVFSNGGNTNVNGCRVQFFTLGNASMPTGTLKIRASWATSSDVVFGVLALSGLDPLTSWQVAADTQSASGTLPSDPETETLNVPSSNEGVTITGYTSNASITPAGTFTELYRDNSLLRSAQLTIAFGGTTNGHSGNMNTVGTNWVGRGIHIIGLISSTTVGQNPVVSSLRW